MPPSSNGTRAGDGEAWREVVDGFMPNAELAFGVLGTELWSRDGAATRRSRASAALGRRGLAEFGGDLAAVVARLARATTFASERVHGLLAPWVLHTGLGPDAATSGFMTQVIAVAIEARRDADPARRRRAPRRRARPADRGPRRDAETGREVDARARRGGAAAGVRLADGDTVERLARRRVRRHADPAVRPPARQPTCRTHVVRGRTRFRYGRSEMQIHFALSRAAALGRRRARSDETALLHLTPGLDGVSRAVNEAERGLLPAEATVVVGQPLTIDRVASAGGQWHALDPAPGAAVARGGRRRRRARRRRRHLDRVACASATRTGSRRGSRATSPNFDSLVLGAHGALAGRPPGGERRTSSTATRTPGRSPWTRTSSGVRSRRSPATGLPSTALADRRVAPGPGPGLGAGSGTLVARSCCGRLRGCGSRGAHAARLIPCNLIDFRRP